MTSADTATACTVEAVDAASRPLALAERLRSFMHVCPLQPRVATPCASLTQQPLRHHCVLQSLAKHDESSPEHAAWAAHLSIITAPRSSTIACGESVGTSSTEPRGAPPRPVVPCAAARSTACCSPGSLPSHTSAPSSLGLLKAWLPIVNAGQPESHVLRAGESWGIAGYHGSIMIVAAGASSGEREAATSAQHMHVLQAAAVVYVWRWHHVHRNCDTSGHQG